ncbi:hypothetical protein ACWCQQ_29035 [Streptomyces sp. NPDC002143]
MRGQEGIFTTADMTADVHRQHLVYDDFTGRGLRGVFNPDRVAIEKRDGEVVAERTTPPASPSPTTARTPPGNQLHAPDILGGLPFGGRSRVGGR